MKNDVLAEIYDLIERCGSFIPTASLYLNDSECGDGEDIQAEYIDIDGVHMYNRATYEFSYLTDDELQMVFDAISDYELNGFCEEVEDEYYFDEDEGDIDNWD